MFFLFLLIRRFTRIFSVGLNGKSRILLLNVDYFDGTSPLFIPSIDDVATEYWKSDTMFDLKYCNWNKDMLMGVLPNSQFGDVSVINLELPGGDLKAGFRTSDGKFLSAVSSSPLTTADNSSGLSIPGVAPGSIVSLKSPLISDLSALQSQFTILALRQAEALQRWKEISRQVVLFIFLWLGVS